jgi:hypothetical protein
MPAFFRMFHFQTILTRRPGQGIPGHQNATIYFVANGLFFQCFFFLNVVDAELAIAISKIFGQPDRELLTTWIADKAGFERTHLIRVLTCIFNSGNFYDAFK